MTDETDDTNGRTNKRRRVKGLIVTGPLVPASEVESTELVSMPTRRSRTVLLIAAGAGAALVISLALLLFGLRPAQEHKEDALTLYQVAKELYAAGEYDAAMQMIARARHVADGPRAVREIDELERHIHAAPSLEAAQQLINAGSYDAADVKIQSILVDDPGNERALLLRRITKGKSADAAVPAPRARSRRELSDESALEPDDEGEANDAARRATVAVRRRRTPTLHIDSSDEGYVFVDGTRRGRSPLSLALAPGTHTVEFVSLVDPDLRIRKRVVMNANRSARLRFEVVAKPGEDQATASGGSPQPNPAPPAPAQSPERPRQPPPRAEPTMPPSDNLDPWQR